MDYLTIFLTLAAMRVLADASPRPDFIIVSKNSIFGTRNIIFIISQSVVLFNIIKYMSAAYILYLPYHLLKSKRERGRQAKKQKINISNRQAFIESFLQTS
jgi:threonine/homoserine/homoserine lactone efflux protein